MRTHLLKRVQRLFTIVGLITFVTIVALATRNASFAVPSVQGATTASLLPIGWLSQLFSRPQIALISGHAGNDSGAICTDAAGQTTLTEAEITKSISGKAAVLLQRRGYGVSILDEFDRRLDNLQADVLLSLHADSCVELSGYKMAYSTNSIKVQAGALIEGCIDHYYATNTGLSEHPDTITHNMTDYHAFRTISPSTPAAILEMGFLGGDQELLVEQQERVAQGVVDSLDCFLSTLSTPQ